MIENDTFGLVIALILAAVASYAAIISRLGVQRQLNALKDTAQRFRTAIVPAVLFRSISHLAACLGTTTARFSTTRAVFHILLAALFCTPVANVRAQLANLLSERTIAGDCIGAQTANRRALNATSWTSIFAFFTAHVCKTIAALGRAVIAGGDAIFRTLV